MEEAWKRLRDEWDREDANGFNAWKEAPIPGFLVGNCPVFLKPEYWYKPLLEKSA
jgi:hypothetical protein